MVAVRGGTLLSVVSVAGAVDDAQALATEVRRGLRAAWCWRHRAARRRLAARHGRRPAAPLVRRGHLLPDLEPARRTAGRRGAGDDQGVPSAVVGTRRRRGRTRHCCSGLRSSRSSFWLFRDRVGLLGNTIGWPVLSLGLALLVFAGAQPRSWIGRWRVPGAAWLAAISYSLYLVHKAIFQMVESAFGAQLAGRGLIAFAAYAVAALLGGALLYYAVERPGLALRDRWLAYGARKARCRRSLSSVRCARDGRAQHLPCA